MRALLFASITVLNLFPAFALGQCMYAVAPTSTLAEDGPANALTGRPSLQAHWAIDCTGACDSNWSEGGNVDPFFSAAPLIQAGSGCGYLGDQVGTGTCTFDTVVGKKVIARIPGMFCRGNGGVVTGTDNMLGESAPYIVPPYVGTTENLAVLANPLATDPWSSNYDHNPDQIPVGMPFRVGGVIDITPAGSETATFRVEGAGISFTKAYPAQMDSSGTPKELGLAWAYDQDMSTYVTATQAGSIQFWVELEGVKSEVRTLTAVVVSGGSGGGGGSTSTGGGAGGGSGSTPKHGCAAFDGPLAFALGALALAFQRRRR